MGWGARLKSARLPWWAMVGSEGPQSVFAAAAPALAGSEPHEDCVHALAPYSKREDALSCSVVMKKVAWWGWAGMGVLLSALVPACGGAVEVPDTNGNGTAGRNGTPGGSGAPVAIEALPERLASAACESMAACCRSADIPFVLATCRANATPLLQKAVNEALRANIRYDASAAGACIAAYGDYFKGCFVANDKLVEASCSRVFVGTIPLSGACTKSEECAPAADGRGRCDFDSDQAQGVCVGPSASVPSTPHGKLGEACAGSCSGSGDCGGAAPSGSGPVVTTVCFADEGLQCDFATQTCQPLAALGQVCSSGACVAGAFCAQGVCAALKPDGAECSENQECMARRCSLLDPAAPRGTCGAKSLATPATCSGNELLD